MCGLAPHGCTLPLAVQECFFLKNTAFFFFIGLTGDWIFPVNSPMITVKRAQRANLIGGSGAEPPENFRVYQRVTGHKSY